MLKKHKSTKKERFINLSLCYLVRTLISPYISDRNATEPRDTIPATCSAPISLYVSTTTIAESAVRLFSCFMNFTLYTTICSVSDLCIVNSRCFVDLLFDDLKGVHKFTPEILGICAPFLQSFASQ